MKRHCTFVFSIEPCGKGRPRGRVAVNRHTGAQYVRDYTPAPTAHAEAVIRAQVKIEAQGEYFEPHLPLRAVAEFVLVKPPSAPKKRRWPTTKPDLDNTEKLLEDALERFLYSNDAQICDVRKRKIYGPVPCIRLHLCECEPEPDPDWWERMTREPYEPPFIEQPEPQMGIRFAGVLL